MLPKPLTNGLALGAALLTAAFAVKCGQRLHFLGPDSASRGMQILIGLCLAGYANVIPKSPPVAFRSEAQLTRVTATRRLAGQTFTLAGLLYAAVWALAPDAVAFPLALTELAGATLFCFAYCLWICGRDARRTAS
jgi:uncharacterized membrane protein